MADGRRSFGVALVLLLATTACAGGVASTARREDPPRLGHRITSDDLRHSPARWANAYELVTALRPGWLRTRGPAVAGGGVQVFVDGIPMGGVGVLRQLSVAAVTTLEYYDPIRAASRFGPGYSYGAIAISTRAAR